MSNKAQYQTKQRDELLTFLKDRQGQHITVSDVCAYFKGRGSSIGTTTVYRQLEKLVDQGVVAKYVIDVGSPACFEYLGAESHQHESSCFHCKCELCGKLVHMHCEELSQMQRHIQGHHGFTINPRRTVFYGICEDCAAREEA